MRRILLVEPAYRNKYPPLGLMKLSTYHKLKGDYVQFVKGCDKNIRDIRWDRVYISTLFTFHWKITIKTIKYYSQSVDSLSNVIVGCVMATLLTKDIERETGVRVIEGLLNKPGILDKNDRRIIDILTPDYSLLNDIDYVYGVKDSYIGYATRGCVNRCRFCAVKHIEPEYVDYLPLRRQIQSIESIYGLRQHLLLLDNNVLASKQFEQIISDIIALGFEKGARIRGRNRHVDFNQGIDIRLLTPEKMELLSRIALRPLRLAFDHVNLREKYIQKVRLAVDNGIQHLSNYVLYNYTDTPQDFYERLRINLELNQELGIRIYSFPMKYIPLRAKDRYYIGKHWNRRLIRGVQCILLATMGKVGPNIEFFEAAFGRNAKEFIEIAMMPEEYIIQRRKHQNNGALEWSKIFRSLTPKQQESFMEFICSPDTFRSNIKFQQLLEHYEK